MTPMSEFEAALWREELALYGVFAAEAASTPDVARDDHAAFAAWLAAPSPAEVLPEAAE